MIRIKHVCSALVTALVILASNTSAKAQYIPLSPFEGFGNVAQQNISFDNNVYPPAWQGHMDAARLRGQMQFDAMRNWMQAQPAYSPYFNQGPYWLPNGQPYIDPSLWGYWLPPSAYPNNGNLRFGHNQFYQNSYPR